MALVMRFMACLVLVALAEAAIDCGTVLSKVEPCGSYMSSGGAVPPQCCSGLRGLINMAQTTPDRRQACHCLQSAAQGVTGIKPDLAATIPRACNLILHYPITGTINCNSIS